MGWVKAGKKYPGVYKNELANGDVSYSIVYTDGTGKKRRVVLGRKSQGITATFCSVKRNEIIVKLKTGGDDPLKHRKRKKIVTLDDIAMKHYELKGSDKQKRRYELHVKPVFGDRDVESITHEEIKRFAKAKAQKLSPKTVNMIVDEIRSIYNTYGKGENPARTKKVQRIKVSNERERFLSRDEIGELLERVEGEDDLYLFCLLALGTGGRLRSVSYIKARDVNLGSCTIMLTDEKTKERYPAYIKPGSKLFGILKERIAELSPNAYLLDYGKERVNRIDRHIQKRLQPILDELFNEGATESRERVVVHTLRHTFASHLAIEGVSIYEIMKLLNHKNIETTMRYAKLQHQAGRDAVSRLPV